MTTEDDAAERAEYHAWVKAGRPRDETGRPVDVPPDPYACYECGRHVERNEGEQHGRAGWGHEACMVDWEEPEDTAGSLHAVAIYADELAEAEHLAEVAAARLLALRRHGRGPVGPAGCCRAWMWLEDALSGTYGWHTMEVCGDARTCAHAHHQTDGPPIAIG
jgi:hypothetical protein